MGPRRGLLVIGITAALVSGCERAGRGAKEALNKGGELAGRAASEVAEGVVTGVAEAWTVDVQLTPELSSQGLVLGVSQVTADSNGRNNRMHIYLSSTTERHDSLQAVAYDKDGKECGRSTLVLHIAAGGADYHELQFQSLTDLSRKSRVQIGL